MTYSALRRNIAGFVLSLLMVVAAPAVLAAQMTGDTAATGQTMNQSSGQVAPSDDQDDDGMDLGWLGLLGLAGLLGLRRRHEVHRVDTTRTVRP